MTLAIASLLALGACAPAVVDEVVYDNPAALDLDRAAEAIDGTTNGLGAKGIFVWGASVRGREAELATWMAAHRYSDVYLLIKGTSGPAVYDVLEALLDARDDVAPRFRVWAWIAGFSDASHADPAWHYLVGNWVAPDDLGYRAHLTAIVQDAVDPARGRVSEPPDGVMLDDSFQWPSASYGTSTAYRVATLMATVDALRGVTPPTLRLGFAPHPETTIVAGTTTEIMTAAAVAYGQDVGELGKRCDLLAPETYRYDYHEPASWIGAVVEDVLAEVALESGAHAQAVTVAPVLVLYHGDADSTPLTAVELAVDRAAVHATSGFSVFRFMTAGIDAQPLPTAAQDEVLDNP